MTTIWDMIVNSRYPDQDIYFYIGIILFCLSILLSCLIIPFVIYFIWDILKPLLMRRAIFTYAKHDFHQFLITLLLFIAVTILNVLTVIMGIHGIYFLTQIKLNRNLVQEIQEGKDRYFAYIIPSSHQILYFLEAALEAARENLLLWGFLFLANIICKLVAKNFHFKTFTILLVARVLFVFICHYNIWELISNHVGYELEKISYSILPFHTFTKLLRTFEILLDILVYIPFLFYLRKIIKDILRAEEQRPDVQDTPRVFDTLTRTLCDRDEMLLIRKYMTFYTFLLVIELTVNIIECHLPNFIVKYFLDVSTQQVIVLEMVMAVINQFLSLVLPVLTIIFIINLINYIRQTERAQDNQPSYGTMDALEEESWNANLPKKLPLKRILVNSGVVITIALAITLFSSYLWYTPGNRAHLVMKQGDFIRLDQIANTSFEQFMSSCDRVTASLNVSAQFTMFDLNLLVTESSISPEKCDESDSIIFHSGYDEKPESMIQQKNQTNDDLEDDSSEKWYPKGTYFDCSNKNLLLEFTGKNYTFPCYITKYHLSGLVVTCDTANSEKVSHTCYTNESTRCYIENSAVLRYKGKDLNFSSSITYELNIITPKYIGTGKNYSYTSIGDADVTKNHLIEFLEIGKDPDYVCHVYLVCHYSAWKSVVLVLGLFLFVSLYLGLALVCLSKTLFKNWNFL